MYLKEFTYIYKTIKIESFDHTHEPTTLNNSCLYQRYLCECTATANFGMIYMNYHVLVCQVLRSNIKLFIQVSNISINL